MKSLLLSALLAALIAMAEARHQNYPPGVTAAYLLRLRGFIADEFSLVTKSGYVLTITRGRNPLFEGRQSEGREPILFLHGVLCNANNFLLNSFDVRPKDLSGLDFSSMCLDEVRAELAGEASAKSLAFLALNRGHVVWILARRGTPGSQQRLGDPLSIKPTPTNATGSLFGNSTLGYLAESLLPFVIDQPRLLKEAAFSLDVKYWDFSLDQQAVEDFPLCIEFVLNNTPEARRVAVVGHSAGGALALIGLSEMPPELRRRVSVAVLWSPSYATSNNNTYFNTILRPLVPVTALSQGPLLLPPFLVEPFLSSVMLLCGSPLTWTKLCETVYDLLLGFSGGKQPMRPQFVVFGPYSTSGHELTQQGQTVHNPPNHTLRKYDYGFLRNMIEYGRPKPPAYDLSNLDNSTRLSFYTSRHDALVTTADVEKTRDQLKIPSLLHVIDDTFNHVGYYFHDETQIHAVIPSMYDIETLARNGAQSCSTAT